MPITAGDFTASQLVQAQVTADRMWSDDMRRADFVANVDVVNAVRAEQNANVEILENPEKDRTVKIHWINSCGTDIQAVDSTNDDCDIAGNQLGTDSKTYDLGFHKKAGFTVDELAFRTNDYNAEQAIAAGILKCDKALSEAIAASTVARIESFKGVNVVADGVGTPNGATTETDVAAADWNERLFAYLYRVAIQNEMPNPYLLSGTNLFEDQLVTMLAQANANGKGAANLYNLMRRYFDLFNIDAGNSPDLKTYMINRGTLAFASKNYYSSVPTRYKEQDRYSVPSRNLPGVSYDVYYTNRCSGNTILHDFMLKAKYDIFLNPTGCSATRTGVLAFNKTA